MCNEEHGAADQRDESKTEQHRSALVEAGGEQRRREQRFLSRAEDSAVVRNASMANPFQYRFSTAVYGQWQSTLKTSLSHSKNRLGTIQTEDAMQGSNLKILVR